MIGSIRGKIVFKADKYALIETGGVGYKVNFSSNNLAVLSPSEEGLFWIHSHIREDAFDLYGFSEKENLDFFEMLLTVSGIGPKVALSVIDAISFNSMRKAILSGNVQALVKISGIGRKTAERIILELKEKISLLGEKTEEDGSSDELDVLEALESLGYSKKEAREALREISIDAEENIETKIKEVLKILSKRL